MVKIGNISLTEFPLLLAPMEDVSDPPFRYVCKMQGADLVYTEFISSEGLIREAIKSKVKLDIFEHERPVGIQIFGGDEDAMALSSRIVDATQPDLIDINFGCPVKKVVGKGAGAAVLKDLPLMRKLATSVVTNTSLPTTVKTRLGWDEYSVNVVDVATQLQDVGIQALSIHGRTRCQMYRGNANWEWIRKVKEHPHIHIPIFGNGDIDCPEKAKICKEQYGVDGIMIGRAAIGYPWIFKEIKHFLKTGEHLLPPDIEERVRVIRIHLQKSIEWKGKKLGLFEMRRHYANYIRGFPDVKLFRTKLVTTQELEEIDAILEELLTTYRYYQHSSPTSYTCALTGDAN